MNVRRYFSSGPNDYLCREASQALNPEGPSTSSQICVGRELHSLVQQEANARMRRQTIPKRLKRRLPIVHGSMAYRRLANGVIKNIPSTNSNEKRFEIGNSNMKNTVKKT